MQPLHGIRILDLTRLLPGPFGSLVLADLGAQVDKLESPGAGDYLRFFPPQVDGQSVAYHALNRNKRSALLDLKKPAGAEAFRRLAGSYDVLFEQFRPGVMARLGCGHDALRQAHPRLIVCALTGYGQTGPLASRAGHDLNYLARAGLLAAQGPTGAPAQVPGFQLADVSGGMWCVIAILAALRERDQTGQGQVLDIAMADGVLGFATASLSAALAGHTPARGDDLLTGGIAPYGTYLSEDGRVVTLASLEPKFWLAFCAGAGVSPDARALVPGDHQAALRAELAALFASRPAEHWRAFGAEHDCCLEVALTADELRRDPQALERGLLFELPTGEGGSSWQIRTPVTAREREHTPAARAGAHSRAIFGDAGFSATEIDALLGAGVLSEG